MRVTNHISAARGIPNRRVSLQCPWYYAQCYAPPHPCHTMLQLRHAPPHGVTPLFYALFRLPRFCYACYAQCYAPPRPSSPNQEHPQPQPSREPFHRSAAAYPNAKHPFRPPPPAKPAGRAKRAPPSAHPQAPKKSRAALRAAPSAAIAGSADTADPGTVLAPSPNPAPP